MSDAAMICVALSTPARQSPPCSWIFKGIACGQITLNPTKVAIGGPITVTGNGFTPGGLVNIVAGGPNGGTTSVIATASGNLPAGTTVTASTTPGSYIVTATDVSANVSTTASYTVSGLSI